MTAFYVAQHPYHQKHAQALVRANFGGLRLDLNAEQGANPGGAELI